MANHVVVLDLDPAFAKAPTFLFEHFETLNWNRRILQLQNVPQGS